MAMITIQNIAARAVIAPLGRPITTATHAIERAPLVLIDVKGSNGAEGRAYVFGYTPDALGPIVGFAEAVGVALQGHSAKPGEVYTAMSERYRLIGRQGALGMALAGIDLALWDLNARSQDLPVCALLGGQAQPVQAYDSHGVFVPDRDEPLLEASLAQGFRAIKIKGGLNPVQDMASFKRAREVIGPDVALMVDYNQSLSAEDAIARLRQIEETDINLAWVEEPVPAEDFAGHIAVKNAVETPLQTGENWWYPEDAKRAIEAGICDHSMPDMIKIGGITGWQKATELLVNKGIPVSSHLFIEATAHVMPTTPGAHLLEYLELAGAVLRDPLEVKNGCVTAKGPGLGMEWNGAAIARYAA